MKVIHRIRELDSVITINKTKYHFKPVAGVGLVCDIADEDVVRAILAMGPEFELVHPEVAAKVDDDAADDETQMQHDTEKADREAYELMTLEELQEAFHQRYGRAAHPATKHETLVDKLCKPADEE